MSAPTSIERLPDAGRPFAGPQKLRWLVPLLGRIPRRTSGNLLAALNVLRGLTSRYRWRVATTWAAAQARSRWDRYRLTFALFANHGRFMADEIRFWRDEAEDLDRDVTIEGREHLDALQGGAILLGWHVGPPVTGRTLAALGYPVRTAGRLGDADEGAGKTPTPRERADGLQHARVLIRNGTWLYMAADGRGREAFRIDVPGRDVIIRAGWLALRRVTGAPVLPVVCRRDGARRIITVHPPLPGLSPDRAEDEARCRTVLSAILNDYARRYPEQCRYVLVSRRRDLLAAQTRQG
jgi:lauroyl/myristoyl acyltransferase